jgi:serine/threonine-protein kinase 19
VHCQQLAFYDRNSAMERQIVLNRKRVLEEGPQIPSVYSSPSKKLKSGLPSVTLSQDQFRELPCDTLVVLESLRRDFPRHEKFIKIRVPVIMKSQVYCMLSDHTQVEKELEMLQSENKIRLFKIISSQYEYAILFVEDYEKAINFMKHTMSAEANSLLDKFMNSVLPRHIDTFITKMRLKELLEVRDDLGFTSLVNAGVLTIRDTDSFWFSVPNFGVFYGNLVKGRTEILKLLNKTKFKEMFLSELEKKKLRLSALPIPFLLKDMIGLGILERVTTTTGNLIKCSRGGLIK